MTLRAFHLWTQCPRSAVQGRLAGSICQPLCAPLCQKTIKIHRIHNLRGTSAAADKESWGAKFGLPPLFASRRLVCHVPGGRGWGWRWVDLSVGCEGDGVGDG